MVAAIRLEWWPRCDWNRWPPSSESADVVDLAVVDLVRGHQPETGMVVILVVPGEELPTELPGIFDAAEALGKAWLVFQGFEVALREPGLWRFWGRGGGAFVRTNAAGYLPLKRTVSIAPVATAAR